MPQASLLRPHSTPQNSFHPRHFPQYPKNLMSSPQPQHQLPQAVHANQQANQAAKSGRRDDREKKGRKEYYQRSWDQYEKKGCDAPGPRKFCKIP